MVAQAIGRLGNWFNQELYGMPTTLPWGLKLNDADAIGKSEICYNGQACPTGTLFHPTFLYEMIWNLIGAAIIVWLGHKLVDVLKSGQQFAMYMMWYGLGRTWIESIRINYSTIILGLRVNVWTAIIVFPCRVHPVRPCCGAFGSETRDLTSRLRAVTADEMERQRQLEERAAAKSGKMAKTAKPETPAENRRERDPSGLSARIRPNQDIAQDHRKPQYHNTQTRTSCRRKPSRRSSTIE